MELRSRVVIGLILWICASATALGQGAGPSVQWFPAPPGLPAADAAKQPSEPPAWLPLLNTATLTFGRYRLRANATDGQSPHARDEVYFIVSGRAKLEAGGETRAMAAGDSVFVAARIPHRFVDIEEDLDVAVFFSSARAPTGGMAAGPQPTEQTPFPETSQRGSARVFYWFGPDSAGQVALDYGQPRWQQTFDAFLTKPSGRRWRLGENFWTSLDTNMPLTCGGAKLPIGAYYLVLENTAAHGLQLVCLDPQTIRTQRLDAYEAHKTTGGIVVPLTLLPQKATSKANATERLEFALDVDRSQRDHATLTIRFGPHVLTAPIVMHPHRASK